MEKLAVVIGGYGFIGIHCLLRLLREEHPVLCIDNLSRTSARANRLWLEASGKTTGKIFRFEACDIREADALREIMQTHAASFGGIDLVIHQAAQVAVTTSVEDPRLDFTTNALGTFNVLEAVRAICPEVTLLFSSTNKVYGHLKGIPIREMAKRYEFEGIRGIAETQPLDFYSPYGCSKGAADQYVRDYSRIYDLRSFVFRQSCIYGTRQFGQEDQGWVAWFVIASVLKKPITIFGTGKQVRDLLWVDDLIEAYWKAWRGPSAGGEIFNMGGGWDMTLSLRELCDLLRENDPEFVEPSYMGPRPGDQPVYISDISKARNALAWKPIVAPQKGVEKLLAWVHERKDEVLRAMST